MKKRVVITMVFCLIAIALFAISVGAEDCVEHTNNWSVELGSEGFLGKITATGECSVCGTKTTEEIEPLFITRGYSYEEDGGITQGYGINRPAIERYEELSGETVKYGAVIALRDTIGDISPLDKDGLPVSDKVKSKDYTETTVSIVNVAVKAIPEASRQSAKILCAFYINVSGVNTYIDNGAEKISCDAKTFDEVKAVPEKDTASLSEYKVIKGQRYHEMTKDELGLTFGMYWNNRQSYSGDSTSKKFWATNKYFTKDELPNGTIIYVENSEWQYRPHKYHSSTFARPDTTKAKYTVVDDSWWQDTTNNATYEKVGFNISYYNNATATNDVAKIPVITDMYTADNIADIFKIYVPVAYTEVSGGDDTTGEDEETTTSPDYSALKQDWNDDGELKILAIGNSFSVDAMEYVYQVATSAGVENVTLGNLYIGGCSLSTHLNNAKNDSGAYTYYTNTSGTWSSTGGKTIKSAVESDDWDFITFQQVSGYSGVADSYADLVDLINIVEPLNPSARLAWHMTWAYQNGSGHPDFSKYDSDQMTMYNAIVSAVQSKIVTNEKIELIIPSGTAIQNARTSYIGDTLTRDGYHLSYDLGSFIASVAFFKALTGSPVDNITYAPGSVDINELNVAIESANNAVASPFVVTSSQYTENPSDSGDSGDTGSDDATEAPDAGAVGEIPEGYVQLSAEQMGLTANSYYNNNNGSNQVVWGAASDSFANGFMATHRFTKDTLPVGSVIEIADGWQYRAEAWAWNASNGRPSNITTTRVVITEEWWSTYTERAFNVSQVDHVWGSPVAITLTEEEVASTIFKIMVPSEVAPEITAPSEVTVASSKCDEEIVTIDGVTYRALTIEAMGLTKNAYYYSDEQGPSFYLGDSNTAKKFFATGVFTKADLPEGSLIWVNSGWQYRPEGWAHTGTRPGNTTSNAIVNESWWGSYEQRAFNISTTGGDDISGDTYTLEKVYENFKIYIPTDKIVEEVAQ